MRHLPSYRKQGDRLIPLTAWTQAARETGIRKEALIAAARRAERDNARMHVYANGTLYYMRPATEPQPIPSVLVFVVDADGSLVDREATL